MFWKELKVHDIASTNLYFYDNDHKATCEKICKSLGIEVFPEISGQNYQTFDTNNHSWSTSKISETQKIQITQSIFASDTFLKIKQTPSNILFAFDKDVFEGLLHFTDYSIQQVYNVLYQNFHEYELGIRKLLWTKGIKGEQILEYFQYKHKKDKLNEYFSRMAKEYHPDISKPYDSLLLSDLLNISISSYLKKKLNLNQLISLEETDKKGIINLRNLVMHSKDYKGRKERFPYNLDDFANNFFNPLLSFKKSFTELKQTLFRINIPDRVKYNKTKLKGLEDWDSDDIIKLFMNGN